MIKIYGLPISPHTRKVIVTALLKDIAYQVDPVIPLRPPEYFPAMSPLGKIPVLQDGSLTLADSSVICAYLEATHPKVPIYPKDPIEYARALWFEEYVDGGLVQDVIGIVFQKVIRPEVLDEETDHGIIEEILTNSLPKKLEYIEDNVETEFLVANQFSISDIALTSSLINLHYAGFRIDSSRFPMLDAYFKRLVRYRPFAEALKEEQPFTKNMGLDTAFLD